MTTTQRPNGPVTGTHPGRLLLVHILVSLALWLLIYSAARAVFF